MTHFSPTSVLVIIPAFNAAPYLVKLLGRLGTLREGEDILFVDDGSTDGSGRILENNGRKVIRHAVNRGKGEAIRTGLKFASEKGYGLAATMDCDLQHPPELLPQLVEKAGPRTIVVGWRKRDARMPMLRRFSNWTTSLLLSVRTGRKIHDSQCGYRVYPAGLSGEVPTRGRGFQFESEVLIRCALRRWRIEFVPIPTLYDGERSAMRNFRDTYGFVRMFLESFFW